MKYLLFFFLILSASNANAVSDDWRGKDKQLHFWWATALGTGSVLALNMVNYEGNKTLVTSTLCLGVSTMKEVSDINSSGFDVHDLTYSALGCALGIYTTTTALSYWQPAPDAIGIIYKKRF